MSMRKLLGLVMLLMIATAAVADTVKLKSDHPDRYVVVKGDTLWDISARFLENPWLWPEVWSFNPQIKNPHLIYPGDVVYLEYDAQGRPVLKVQRGQPTVKLSPTVRAARVEVPIATIPLDAIRQFLGHPRVISKREMENSAYIVAGNDNHLISGTGDRIYARGVVPGQDPNSVYSVLRIGKAYRNPGADRDDVLGYEALHVADAKVLDFGDPATLRLTQSNRETLVGDRLVPKRASDLDQTFIPHSPTIPVEGKIISVVDGVSRIGQYQTVVINKGEQDGMETGNVLAVYQSGKTVRDNYGEKHGEEVTLPEERAGIILVFRTYDRVSYALVMEAQRDMRVYDAVRNP
jgi:hypothetical protein